MAPMASVNSTSRFVSAPSSVKGLTQIGQCHLRQGDAEAAVSFFDSRQGQARERSDHHLEATRLLAQTDPHSPSKFRVDGVVPNLPEFSAAFGCKAPDAMFAAKGCRVW